MERSADKILFSIKKTLSLGGSKNKISLHEPSFKDTKALEYLKDSKNKIKVRSKWGVWD